MVDLTLYLVADESITAQRLSESIQGGVTLVQFRCKTMSDREFMEFARPLQLICAESGIPIIVNDRIDLALVIGAQGVHLGVDDLPLSRARALAPAGFTIGYSPETDAQAASAAHLGADYLGIGPFASTSTKLDAGKPLGQTDFARRVACTSLPVVGIGGVNANNAALVRAAGADGVAVSSAILHAPDPKNAAKAIRQAMAQ